ncbi:hypothetical protein ACFC06_16985 [Nocardia sp. NPDC056064]|uniref:hypothetical protein n=1 Tax=Nocardia sp. NPDC056064 TaxID=3345701 RepID=UPI0035E0C42A
MKVVAAAFIVALIGVVVAIVSPLAGGLVLLGAAVLFVVGCVRVVTRDSQPLRTRRQRWRAGSGGAAASGAATGGGFLWFGGDSGDGGGSGSSCGGGGGCGGGGCGGGG